MKKVILSLSVMVLLVGGAFSQVKAQEKKTAFSLNLGVQTNLNRYASFSNAWFTLDARAGIVVGKSFEFSPEVMAAVDDSFNFDAVWLYPGVMVNFKVGGSFFGAGAVLPLLFWKGGSDSGNPAPKVNFGFRAGNLTLSVYIMTWTGEDFKFLEVNFIGATLGYLF